MEADESGADLDGAVGELRQVTDMLNRRARLISAASVLNLVGLVLAASLPSFRLPWTSAPGITVGLVLAGISAVLVMLGLIGFDRDRRRGNSIFEEVSDELQWSVLTRASEPPRQRPDLAIRIALRGFNDASKLPITRGYRGVQIYGIVNVLLLLAVVALDWLNSLA
jgi:hypothetical protein